MREYEKVSLEDWKGKGGIVSEAPLASYSDRHPLDIFSAKL